MAAGRATTFWLLLAAPGVALAVIAASNRIRPAAPDAPPAEPAPVATTIAAPPATVQESRETREDDSVCRAAGNDPREYEETYVGHAWEAGPDGDRRIGAPDVHIRGRLVDVNGAPMAYTQLRFWTRDSQKTVVVDAIGEFDLETDVEDAVYDVDAILSDDAEAAAGERRVHVGRLRSGARDGVLKLKVAQIVLVSGALLDDDGRPLPGWTVVSDRRHNGRGASDTREARTDAAGRFRLVAWKKEPVALHVRTQNDMRRTIVREDVDGKTGEIRIRVAPPGIAGHVVAERGASPAGAIVRLRRDGESTTRSLVVDDTGLFCFDGLESTAYYALSAEFGDGLTVTQYHCSGDEQDVCLYRIRPDTILEGRAVDAIGAPLANTWVRFVDDRKNELQTMTDADGAFSTTDARDVDYDAFVLVTGAEGRLVPGPKIGRCRGGDRNLQLRASR